MSAPQPPPAANPPAGFYPDASGAMRWWDGQRWTHHLRDASNASWGAVAAPAAEPNNTLRNVLLALLAVGVLFVGGCLALVAKTANDVSTVIESEIAKNKEPGGPNNPLTITEGAPFEVSGFKYAAGWTVGDDGLGSPDIANLKVTNNRAEGDSASVEITFLQGTEVVALANCNTPEIAVGQSATLSCFSSDTFPTSYERITINDTF